MLVLYKLLPQVCSIPQGKADIPLLVCFWHSVYVFLGKIQHKQTAQTLFFSFHNMQVHTVQYNDTIYNIGDCVEYNANLAVITAFSIQDNQVQGYKVIKCAQQPNQHKYNKYIKQQVQKATLPQTQECFLSFVDVEFLITDISRKVQLVSFAYYLRNCKALSQDIQTYYWTHYVTSSNKLCRRVYTPASELATPLLRQLSPSTNTHPALFNTYTSSFIQVIKAHMHNGKGHRRISRIVHPFCLEAYHHIFTGVGEQIPPSVVSATMKFTTYMYTEDMANMDNKLSRQWREKIVGTDTFLRITSIKENTKSITAISPPTIEENPKKRKRNVRVKQSDGGDILFVAEFDLCTSMLTLKFSYHKYWLKDINANKPIPVWM